MSMTGLAASPGTAVEPTCSSCSTRQPRASRIRSASSSYCRGQAGSGSVTSIPTVGAVPGTHRSAPGGSAESANETISARLGTLAAYYPLIDRSGDQPTIGSMCSGVQITQCGVTSGGHLGDQVADHIGSVRSAPAEGRLRSVTRSLPPLDVGARGPGGDAEAGRPGTAS